MRLTAIYQFKACPLNIFYLLGLLRTLYYRQHGDTEDDVDDYNDGDNDEESGDDDQDSSPEEDDEEPMGVDPDEPITIDSD